MFSAFLDNSKTEALGGGWKNSTLKVIGGRPVRIKTQMEYFNPAPEWGLSQQSRSAMGLSGQGEEGDRILNAIRDTEPCSLLALDMQISKAGHQTGWHLGLSMLFCDVKKISM